MKITAKERHFSLNSTACDCWPLHWKRRERKGAEGNRRDEPQTVDCSLPESATAVHNGIQGFERRGTGSFRAWIKTIAWRCWCQAISRAERRHDLELIQSLKNAKAWRAFQMTAIESLPGSEVAIHLGMRIDAVYAARCRVQGLITEEYAQLDQVS